MIPARGAPAALAVLLLLEAGCFVPTWRAQPTGARPARGTTVLAGRIAFVPPIGQYGPIRNNTILAGGADGNVIAHFTTGLGEPFETAPHTNPLQESWTAWMPVDGWFFIEVPEAAPVYLRGFEYLTDRGKISIAAPMRLPLVRGEPVAYVGEITVVRSGERRVSVRHRLEDARKVAQESGQGGLLGVPWAVRLAEPVR